MFARMICLIAVTAFWTSTASGAGDGRTAWYAFENNLADSSGNGYAGTIASGAPTYVVGRSGQDHAIRIQSGDSVAWTQLPKPAAITVSLWVKPNSPPPAGRAWLLDEIVQTSGVWRGWQLRTEGPPEAAKVYWVLADPSGVRQSMVGSTAGLYNGQWHHIVGTHDGANTARLYYDGRLVAQNTSLVFVPAPPATAMRLNNTLDTQFHGMVDDIIIWDRALNTSEIAALYAPRSGAPGFGSHWVRTQDYTLMGAIGGRTRWPGKHAPATPTLHTATLGK